MLHFDAAFAFVIAPILVKNLISCWIMATQNHITHTHTHSQSHRYLCCVQTWYCLFYEKFSMLFSEQRKIHEVNKNRRNAIHVERRMNREKRNCNSLISSTVCFIHQKENHFWYAYKWIYATAIHKILHKSVDLCYRYSTGTCIHSINHLMLYFYMQI